MDILHGSSPLLILVNINMAETVRLRGFEPLADRGMSMYLHPATRSGGVL
jgi:hypothetical protein